MGEAHTDQGAGAMEGPIACDRSPARCSTSADCPGPTAASNQEALAGEHHTALVDLQG